MSFLPYGASSAGGWFASTAGAVVLHGAALALGAGGLQDLLTFAAQETETRPQYTITLAPLDSDTIAGLELREGEAGTDDGDGIDPVAPEVAETPEREQLAALAPTEAIAAEPVTPDVLEPETEPAAKPEAPETFAGLTPETPQAVVPDAPLPAAPIRETVQPVAPAAPVPQDTGPLIPETVTALPAPQTLSPVAPQGTAALLPTPAPAAQETVSPVPPTTQTIRSGGTTTSTVVSAVTPRPAPAPASPRAAAPAPSAQDLAIGDLLRRIRSAVVDPCLIALPRRDGESGVGLAMVASNDRTMANFSDAVLTAEDEDIRQTRVLVDERQCSALNFVRQNIDYPATRLGVRLDSTEVPSGGRLTGVLRGTAGRYVTLLLIDNNGVVQDLQRFMSFSGNFARFDVPVTRAGQPRDTKQVLLAIATRRPAPVLRNRAGRLAQDVFAGLEGEVATQGALAVTTFDVR
ncbi:MAG: serine/threonine protein kinase [Sulfitobacter sp.]